MNVSTWLRDRGPHAPRSCSSCRAKPSGYGRAGLSIQCTGSAASTQSLEGLLTAKRRPRCAAWASRHRARDAAVRDEQAATLVPWLDAALPVGSLGHRCHGRGRV